MSPVHKLEILKQQCYLEVHVFDWPKLKAINTLIDINVCDKKNIFESHEPGGKKESIFTQSFLIRSCTVQ